jgi:hypothetical protein
MPVRHRIRSISHIQNTIRTSPRNRADYGELGFARRIPRRLGNGYTNWRFGTSRFPASRLGPAVISGVKPFKLLLDKEFRHSTLSFGGTIYSSTPRIFAPQVESAGLEVVDVVGGRYPDVQTLSLTPWHFYACRKPLPV